MKVLKRTSAVLISAFLSSVAPVTAVHAMTVDLTFSPPKIQPQAICTVRPPDDVTTALWDSWDGKALPNMSSAEIKRDLNRLLHLDARKWYDTVAQIIKRLAERDSSFAGQNAQLTQIIAMEAAGQYEELRKLQLVPKLARNDETLSPRVQNILSRFYRDGVGVARNMERADELLVAAGYSGNADALLALSSMRQNGRAPTDWNVPSDLAVSMAFGSLLGELNATICDRSARIAREYLSGEVVTQDKQLAHDWFRFTADLGDAYAAWKVVEFHLESEGFEKTNSILLKYLTQAADAGLPYAQIELGRMYEVGSLVEKDLEKALSLYLKAAENGERPSLTRVALFLEQPGFEADHYSELRLKMLTKLTELDNPPGWAFARLAQARIEKDGLWDAIGEAEELLQRAANLGDLDGIVRYAELLLAQHRSEEDFERAVELLSQAMSIHGGVTPSSILQSAFICRAFDGPRVFEAKYWKDAEAASASSNLELTANEIIALGDAGDKLQIATLQSHALYGRPAALAAWLKLIETADFADDELRTFWAEHSNQYVQVLNVLAKLEFELAENRAQRLAAFGLLQAEYKRSGPEIALQLAQALLSNESSDDRNETANSRKEAEGLLHTAALLGQGQAMVLLAGLDPKEGRLKEVYETYRDVIASNGDFHSLLLALPFLAEEERRRYLARAIGVMHCDYKNVVAMADAHFSLGYQTEGMHWLEIAELLTGGNAWALTDLAKLRLHYGGSHEQARAETLFVAAKDKGNGSAARELFQLYTDEDSNIYQPIKAVALIEEAIAKEQFDLLTGYLGRFRKANDTVRSDIEANLDLPSVYLTAAQAGDVFSMRSYGQYLRSVATSAAELKASTDWLRRAAEAGDTTAMAVYGQALAFGIGTTADSEGSLVWLERAAANGSKSAAQITELVTLGQKED